MFINILDHWDVQLYSHNLISSLVEIFDHLGLVWLSTSRCHIEPFMMSLRPDLNTNLRLTVAEHANDIKPAYE